VRFPSGTKKRSFNSTRPRKTTKIITQFFENKWFKKGGKRTRRRKGGNVMAAVPLK